MINYKPFHKHIFVWQILVILILSIALFNYYIQLKMLLFYLDYQTLLLLKKDEYIMFTFNYFSYKSVGDV